MRDPALRARIISEYPSDSWEPAAGALKQLDTMYLMNDPPNYEPSVDDNLDATAKRAGIASAEYVYDILTQGDGRTIIYIPSANYVDGKIAAVEPMPGSEVTVPGLGDGGAHCATVCDASLPTYMLLHWTGDETGRFSLPAMEQRHRRGGGP